eukprot:3933724-Rhodomonas_salina.1
MRAQGVQSLPRLWEAFEERLLATVKRNGRRVILWQDAWEAGLRLPNDTILQPPGRRSSTGSLAQTLSVAQVWKGLHDIGSGGGGGIRRGGVQRRRVVPRLWRWQLRRRRPQL